ncbi:MAG: YdeI/OmpD-associated family protein [Anaerolineae bacterium]|nr:YdeI/OmpD-associated family protein [Anaerolineae bacterium]
MTNLPTNSLQPATLADWRAWLADNHARPEGVWLITYRPATGKTPFSYEQAVEEALCFGWIDGQANKLDDERTMLWFAPRRPGSGWARTNKARIERLIADGRMTPAGLSKIEAAQADGSWTLLDSVERLEVPDDLAAEFDKYPDARAHFDAFPPSARRMALAWIATAKRPETRAKRVAETARLAQENVRVNQRRPTQQK